MSTFAPINPAEQGQSTKQVRLGSRFEDSFGRVFYYGYAATAVGRGKMARAAATVDYHNSMNFAVAPAVGDKVVKVTLLGTALTANQYEDGWLTVNDGTGEGRTYPVEGNSAMATTTGTGVIYLGEPIDTAGAVSELNVDLNYNLYDELLPPADNSQAYIPVGVPFCVGGLGAAEYGYVQTWGPCAVWRDDAETLGRNITLGATTGTGQVEEFNNVAEPLIGTGGPTLGVATEYQMMNLKLAR